jgi:hypothetical protein
VVRGQSFLKLPDKTARGEIRHLNVVITEPDEENNVLVVPVCTYRVKDGKPFSGQDESCLLPAGCHPFIMARSYISYRNATAMNLIEIFNGLSKGKFIKKQDFENQFIQDIQRGAEESIFLQEKLKRFFDYFM